MITKEQEAALHELECDIHVVGINFTLVNINSETETFRLVCTRGGFVFDIVEGNLRTCLNRQLELLLEHGYIKERWRIRK